MAQLYHSLAYARRTQHPIPLILDPCSAMFTALYSQYQDMETTQMFFNWSMHNEKWYIDIDIMEHTSPAKKNEIMKLAGKWTELEKIILSEVTQT